MGFKRVPTIYTIENVDGNEGFIVRMKGLQIGRFRKLMNLIESEDDKDFVESLEEIVDFIAEGIVSWNLEEEDGAPVEPNAEGIGSLELSTLMGLVADWLDAISGTSAELGKDSQSGKQFPGAPVTMEAL